MLPYKSMSTKNLIFLSLIAGFILLGINALVESKPQPKSERIYNAIKPYIPYRLDKTLTGYAIISTKTQAKEKPPASQLWKRLDQLEQIWGEQHLKIENNVLIVLDDHNQTIATIPIKAMTERQWLISFFGLSAQ
ncbi:MAG: hypothetical protein HOJ28_02390 [Candidatus Thioglobus sp.]|nr:hypothetical protein [Candidatus Thioglobus sp.]